MKPEKSRTMLVFSLCNGFKHGSIPYWKQALDIMGEKTGAFKVVHSDDMGIFTPDALKQFDVICF
ncbi:MAG: ThuA domain-containing protein, partial [Planctomycetes bacterium]|nr:ThuA domain-containing protein [Planctomycetota bacterium]